MRILLIDNGSFFIDNLRGLLAADTDNDVTVTGYFEISTDRSDTYDLVILSGGHHRVVNHASDFYRREIDTILSGHTPILVYVWGAN